MRAFQWIPTWQGLKSLQNCSLDVSSLSIGKDNMVYSMLFVMGAYCWSPDCPVHVITESA